jgi:hypothetical protein
LIYVDGEAMSDYTKIDMVMERILNKPVIGSLQINLRAFYTHIGFKKKNAKISI